MNSENYIGNTLKTGIYCILNLINNKIYIGSTKVAFSNRKTRHYRALVKNVHYNEHLQNAWNKYGRDNFVFKVLYICNPEECEDQEANFIKLYKCNDRKYGYNIASVKKYRFKYKLSETHITETSKRKKLKATLINGHTSTEKGLNKSVKLYDLNGNFIKEFLSLKEAAKELKTTSPTLSINLKERRLKYKEYIILYSNDLLSSIDLEKVKKLCEKIKVDIYNIDLTLIKSNVTILDATTFLNCEDAEIRMCYTNKRSRIRNFVITKSNNKPRSVVVKYSFKTVLQIDKDGNTIKKWKNIEEILKEFPLYERKNIVRVLRGDRKFYKNYNWKLNES